MFAQLMREMTTDHSFESFRAYSLDSIARLDEAITITEDVERNRLPKEALEPVLSELSWSLSKDPVGKDVASEEIESFANLIKGNAATTDEITQHVVLLRKRLGQNYKTMCEQKILAVFAHDKKRIELRHATGFYCSHLLNAGYSQTYLLRCVDKTFFTTPMHRVGKRTLSKFFGVFDNVPKTFLVYCAVDENFGKYLNDLDQQKIYPSAASIPKHLGRGVTNKMPIAQTQVYLLRREIAHDEDGAVSRVESMLTSARALSLIVPYDMKFEWDKAMYASKLRSTRGTVLRGQVLPLQRALVSPGAARRALKRLTSYSGKVLTHFDENSTERILSSLNTSALARTSSSIENQLISLWSAVEILLSEPPRGKIRIRHYAKLLLPCICLRYIRRQTVAVYNEMLVAYRKKFSTIVNAEESIGETDQHTKFAAILFLPNNSTFRQELISICSGNPLARHRLWKLHRDYHSPQAIKKTLKEHEQRVSWQLYRIYRARNDLVHSGREPSYLDSVVLNLDEYYRACFGTLVNRASREESETDIDQLIAEIGIEYKIYMTYLTSLQREPALSTETLYRAVL